MRVIGKDNVAFIDKQGNIVKFTENGTDAKVFGNNGLVPLEAKDKNCREKLWGYADTSGNFVIPPQFADAEAFASNGLAVAQPFDTKNCGKDIYTRSSIKGYIDSRGQWVIPPQYEEAFAFLDNGLAAKRNKRWVCVGWASAHRVSVARFANDGKPPSEVNAGFCRCAVLFNPHPNPSPIKRGGDFFVRDLRSVRAKRGKCWVHRQARQILDLRVGRASARRGGVVRFANAGLAAKRDKRWVLSLRGFVQPPPQPLPHKKGRGFFCARFTFGTRQAR